MTKHLYFHTDSREDPSILLYQKGALIKIAVSVPDSLEEFLRVQKSPIPKSIIGFGIIDTGASTTCVNQSVLEKLGGAPIGTENVITPSAKPDLPVYPTKITFPGTTIKGIFDKAFGMKDIPLKHNGLPIIAFIGRDVLTNCIFIYNGKTGEYSLDC